MYPDDVLQWIDNKSSHIRMKMTVSIRQKPISLYTSFVSMQMNAWWMTDRIMNKFLGATIDIWLT